MKTKYEIIATIPLDTVLPQSPVSNRAENCYLASPAFLATNRT
jgi:hypothetical protein